MDEKKIYDIMKQILYIFTAFLFCLTASAQTDTYRILYLNTPTINIGGKNRIKGDEFPMSAKIKWASDKQAMRVVSTLTKRQLTLSSKIASGHKTLSSYLKGEKALATRPGYPASIPELRSEIPATIYLLDRYEESTSIPIDENHFFFATYTKDGEEINKKLSALPQGGGFYIDGSLWEIDGAAFTPAVTVISIHYYDIPNGTVTDVISNITIEPLDE